MRPEQVHSQRAAQDFARSEPAYARDCWCDGLPRKHHEVRPVPIATRLAGFGVTGLPSTVNPSMLLADAVLSW